MLYVSTSPSRRAGEQRTRIPKAEKAGSKAKMKGNGKGKGKQGNAQAPTTVSPGAGSIDALGLQPSYAAS